MPAPKITKASFSDDALICDIARQSSFTRDFTSHRFFRTNIEADYEKGFVGISKLAGNVRGFIYCKHLVRKPMSVVHYMGVASFYHGCGIGQALLAWALKTSPWGRVELSCEHRNEAAMKFYERSGLRMIASGFYGKPPKVRAYSRWMLEKAA
jgi:ribosomal protein S18 acetylase RimI-like enzyme